jgi:signal transduction histidine kinase
VIRTALGVAVLLIAVTACSRQSSPEVIVDLSGEHRMLDGDDLTFRGVDFDDTDWKRVELPGTWRADTLTIPGIRWYRIAFDWPADASREEQAVWLGHIGWADEVFLNGELIGATGRLEGIPDFVFIPRLYTIPDGGLRAGRNVLALRTRGAPLGANGLLTDGIGVGEVLSLTRARSGQIARAVGVEAVLLGFALFAWFLLAFFPKRDVTGRAAIFLWIFVTTQIIHLLLGSWVGGQLGVGQDGNTTRRFLVLCIGLSSLWAFIATIARGRLPRVVLGLIAVTVSLGLVAQVISQPAPLVVAMSILGTCADVTVIVLLVGAIRGRTPGAIPASIAYVGALGFIWATLFMDYPFILGVGSYYFGIGWLAVGGLIALARQADAVRKRAQRTTEYALAAHTSERTRLARDLHDGLGQMLALVKLQLQLAGRKLEDDAARSAVEEGAAQVDATLEEMRRIARDLRPAPMEGRSFGEAVRDYAAAMARRSGIEVVVEGELDGPIPEGMDDELYRVVQECLTNCLKHSQASRVVVSMGVVGDGFHLTVTDDGRGLREDAVGTGMGLQTIRERSELLGGSCQFSEPDDGGTRIEVRVPKSALTT